MFGIEESPAMLQQLCPFVAFIRQQNKPLLSLSVVQSAGFVLHQCLPIHRGPGYACFTACSGQAVSSHIQGSVMSFWL